MSRAQRLPPEAREVVKLISKATGRPAKDLVRELLDARKATEEIRTSKSGKFRVVGIDKFSREDWVVGEYNTAEEALSVAREKTAKEMKHASDDSVATVYYAYDPQGNYLGGDTWAGE